MRFSEHFEITCSPADDWFDPILTADTRLFLDPFLLYTSEAGPFLGSHAEVIDFFNAVFSLIARSTGNRSSVPWQTAVDCLRFPEVEELCLGYTARGTRGVGSARQTGQAIAEALWSAIKAGLKQITHFEETGILQEGIGADRISDATAGILKWRLASYTEGVCRRHGVPTTAAHFRAGRFDTSPSRWLPLDVSLPRNPVTGKAVLLMPRRYLRALPSINADDFWQYCFINENDTLRRDFGRDVTSHVPKREIIAFARRHVMLLPGYLKYREHEKAEPYNFSKDPAGLLHWYDETRSFAAANPVTLALSGDDDFGAFTAALVATFKSYVEDQRGWNLLWNENGSARREEAAQDLFQGIVTHYCRANDVDISREPNIGRGPVDFKTSRGYAARALLELKLAKNTRFWNGLRHQLPAYQRAEQVRLGYFVVIVFSDQDLKKIREIEAAVKAINQGTSYEVTTVIVDARRNPPSASTL